MQDIWEYARGRVDNKGVLARIGHSSKLHQFRSASRSKGSAASKGLGLLGVAARAGLNAIPVPAVGSILGAIQQKVEGEVRAYHHKRRGHGGTLEDQVKFTLKDLSVEELDRYRKKVEMAIEDLNKAIVNFPERVKKMQSKHATCDAYLELAEAAEQASRRLSILRQSVIGISDAMSQTLDWANKVEVGFTRSPAGPRKANGKPTAKSLLGVKNEVSELIKAQIEEELALAEKARTTMQAGMEEAFILEYHGECSQWCCFRDQGKPDTMANFKIKAAWVVKNLTDPFGIEDIIGEMQSGISDAVSESESGSS